MANTDFGIHVNVNLNVDERTAKTCLWLVEIYLNDHDKTYISSMKQDDGSLQLRFIERASDGFSIPIEGLVGDARPV